MQQDVLCLHGFFNVENGIDDARYEGHSEKEHHDTKEDESKIDQVTLELDVVSSYWDLLKGAKNMAWSPSQFATIEIQSPPPE